MSGVWTPNADQAIAFPTQDAATRFAAQPEIVIALLQGGYAVWCPKRRKFIKDRTK